MQYALTQSGTLLPGGAGILLRAGAAATGAAIGLTVTRHVATRAASVAILAVGCTTVVSLATARLITLGYVAAVIWWTASAAGRTIRAAFPTLRRSVDRLLPRSAR
jgi:hypothetical protein